MLLGNSVGGGHNCIKLKIVNTSSFRLNSWLKSIITIYKLGWVEHYLSL